MSKEFDAFAKLLFRKLDIDDLRNVEIECKMRVDPDEATDVREWLLDYKGIKHRKSVSFFDQYLDTPSYEVLKAGASLRLRYKRSGTAVYLQYKGPGFYKNGLLYRSEFASKELKKLVREESHHDIVRFSEDTLASIIRHRVSPEMGEAMRRHLGAGVVRRINTGPILALYQKEKFELDLGSAFLEPSLDRISAFHIAKRGLHALSTFCEFENEIKAGDGSLEAKLEHMDELLEFNDEIQDEFELRPERLDKYRRCASFFVK